MARRDRPVIVRIDPFAEARKAAAAEKRDAMRSGVVTRAHTFAAKRGKGSYKRKTKHGGWA